MHKCTYCDRELKSKAGKLRHESACEAREIGGQTEEEIMEEDGIRFTDDGVIYDGNNIDERDTYESQSIVVVEQDSDGNPNGTKVIQLEVMNGAATYYMGHPRRLTKLKGMLSATFDKTERRKIFNMIKELENANQR